MIICSCCVNETIHKNCAPDKVLKLTVALMKNTEKTMKNEFIIQEKIKNKYKCKEHRY